MCANTLAQSYQAWTSLEIYPKVNEYNAQRNSNKKRVCVKIWARFAGTFQSMISSVYQSILASDVTPSVLKLEDKDTNHSSKSTPEWLKGKESRCCKRPVKIHT